MSEATAKYWVARCRRGDPPQPGSPGAALLWAMGEVERLREIEGRALEVNGDPNSSNEAVEISRYILGMAGFTHVEDGS